ncbi:MAG: rod shape-determining protein MreC [Bacteroidales bacterium]|nr:rod shape-determining protein MreC [Bacteroidales bacterium]
MRNILQFLIKYQFLLLFLLLETIAISLVIRYNYYHQLSYLNFAQKWHASVSLKKERIKQYLKLKTVNERLVAENESLRNELAFYKKAFNKQSEQRNIDSTNLRFLVAKVINSSVHLPYNYLTLDKGTEEGVQPNMAVICDQGIVGVVIAVSKHFSVVMPVLNKKFRVSAKFKKNNYFGSFEWSGNNYRIGVLNDIPLHVPVAKGDTIITSGYSNIFPEGIMIGVVEDFSVSMGTFYSINVRLTTDFKNLYYVYLITDNSLNERTTLENSVTNE